MRLRLTICLVRRERIVRVGDGQNAAALTEVGAGPSRLTDVAVIVVCRLHDELHNFLVHAGCLQHVDADIVMQVHQLGFVRAQPAGLEENIIGHADLADVVQERGHFQHRDLRRLPAQVLGDPRRQERYAARVPHRGDVAIVQSAHQAPQHALGNDAAQRIAGNGRALGIGPLMQIHQAEQDARGIVRLRVEERGTGSLFDRQLVLERFGEHCFSPKSLVRSGPITAVAATGNGGRNSNPGRHNVYKRRENLRQASQVSNRGTPPPRIRPESTSAGSEEAPDCDDSAGCAASMRER